MSIELALFIGLLLHLIGDYLTQNDWMATGKTKAHFPALVHATIYSIPFLLICPSPWWLVIYISHFLIDRYRLAVYWIKLVNWNWSSQNFGFGEEKPAWMAVWLMIIVDNTFHVLINSGALCLNQY